MVLDMRKPTRRKIGAKTSVLGDFDDCVSAVLMPSVSGANLASYNRMWVSISVVISN